MGKKFNLADYVQPAASESDGLAEVTGIPPERIRVNPRNFYEAGADVDDLADSISLNGLLDPLVVYRGSGILYTLLSGHRRFRAILQIRGTEGHGHDFDLIPCIVRPAPANTAVEDILLIQANSTGRIRTPADMAEEARRLTAALTELKKQGAELPGRLRDAVAEAMGVSSSKLGRIRAIENNLRVAGFRAAYKAGSLPEAAAYELSQLPEADQYAALDRLIDEGVSYESADIKAVQRIKRQIAAGESTRQDMHVAAEKRGIPIRDEDFSPLLSALVRRALPESWRRGLARCRTKTEGLEHLHRFGFGHHSEHGGEVSYDSDPQGLTLREPVCRRLKWSEVWELLALDALQTRSDSDTAGASGPQFRSGKTPPSEPTLAWCAYSIGGVELTGAAIWRPEHGKWFFESGAEISSECVGWYPLPDWKGLLRKGG